MQYADLTQKIIGCAYDVYNTLGAGFLESVYEQSMLIELREGGLDAQSQIHLDVLYHGQPVGCFAPDILVNDTVIVELKAIESLAKAHEAQLVNYLVATGKQVGLLINFGPEGVTVKRKVRTLPQPSSQSNPSCNPV
ncbi:MAG: GxxExxY protein [Pirellulales bacterium]|nr:GxxExxY protein [Pirellulales bacterium]